MMDRSVKTTSFGRILDSLSYRLGVCQQRTYDGEPAMKLEKLLAEGKLIEGFETEIKSGVVLTAEPFSRIDLNSMKREDVAYSIVHGIIEQLVNSAIDNADSKGIDAIGITGGVSYNVPICKMFTELASNRGHKILFHNKIPNGDGGISLGQAAIAAGRLS